MVAAASSVSASGSTLACVEIGVVVQLTRGTVIYRMQLQHHLKTHMASVLQPKLFCAILNRTWDFATIRPESVVLNQPVLCGMSMEEHPRMQCTLISDAKQHGMVRLVKHELTVWT